MVDEDDNDDGVTRGEGVKIGKQLRAMLERHGITVPQLAELTKTPDYPKGLTRSTLYNALADRRPVGFPVLNKISRALKEPISALLPGGRPETSKPHGGIDQRGVFFSELILEVGVGEYRVEALDEIDAREGDVALFVAATEADLLPGEWVSIRTMDHVQLFQVVDLAGQIGLKQPKRKSIATYSADEHAVVGRLVSLTRSYGRDR
jgi:transcriptional regulator with XRE-family HTH domain